MKKYYLLLAGFSIFALPAAPYAGRIGGTPAHLPAARIGQPVMVHPAVPAAPRPVAPPPVPPASPRPAPVIIHQIPAPVVVQTTTTTIVTQTPGSVVMPNYNYSFSYYNGVKVPYYDGWYYYNNSWCWGGKGPRPPHAPVWRPRPVELIKRPAPAKSEFKPVGKPVNTKPEAAKPASDSTPLQKK